MKICPKCHKTFDDTQNYCDACGSRLTSMQSQGNDGSNSAEHLICPVCGKHYPSGQIYCSDDGARLISSATGKEAEERPAKTAPIQTRDDSYSSELQPDYDTENGYRPAPSPKKSVGTVVAIVIGVLVGAMCAGGFMIYRGVIKLPFGSSSASGGYAASSDTGGSGNSSDSEEQTAEGGTTQGGQNSDQEEQEEVMSPVSNLDIASITSAVNSSAGGGDFSFAVIDMGDGTVVGSDNMSDAQSASAIIDVPILYTAMKSVENGSLDLSTQVTFTYEVDGRGQLKQSDSGKTYPMEELLSYMLHYSDNNATNSLLNYFSYSTINNICSDNGYSVNIVQKIGKTEDYTSNDNYLSPEDTAKMLCEIWNSDTDIGKNFLSSYMVIQDNTRTAGIGKNIDSKVSDFLNFNAVKKDKYNEIAIVEDGDNTYGIVFFGNHGKLETLEEAAAVLGNEVYNGMQ